MVGLDDKIGELAESLLEDDSLFLVDVRIKGNNTMPMVTVKIDGDKGVSIDTCAQLSRKLGNEIEAEGLIDSRYNLEVSSPGLDQPIKLKRQYVNNIGRKVKVHLIEGKSVSGELMEVKEDGITVNVEKQVKNKKKKSFEVQDFAFTDIKKTNILVSFK